MTPMPLGDLLSVTIYVKRDLHDNGMTLAEYADAVIAGTHNILDHGEFLYQFGSVEQELAKVVSWALNNNLTVLQQDRAMSLVQVQGTAEQFNRLFKITLETVSVGDNTFHTHSDSITVPIEIEDVVQNVLGLDNQLYFRHNAIPVELDKSELVSNAILGSPNPMDLSKAYKFPRAVGTDAVQGKGATIAICSLSGGYSQNNLDSTFGRVGLPTPTVITVPIDGGGGNVNSDPSGGNPENMLDIYCVGAVAPASTIIFYSAPNTFTSFVNVVLATATDTTNNPSVLSISWGTIDTYFGGTYYINGVPYTYLTAFDYAFQACIVRGITVFIASGDYGVRGINGAPTYTLNHPSTSPYVVAAGGTVITVNTDYTINAEEPWGTSGGSFAAGGGVSTIYPVPAWQSGLTSKLYPGGTVSALTGRGTPDVSAMATGYTFYYGPSNFMGTYLGTSATAPLLAGMMGRLNALTGRRIGFVNADWYSIGSTAFNDMTSGDNHGGNTVGYMAQAGWDAASGLGTPKGDELYKFYKKGDASIFPKASYGTRPKTGVAYPRRASGVR